MAIIALGILTIEKEVKEEFKLISVSQPSGKVKFYKQVDGVNIHIDKITLEKLMQKYNVVVEEVEK